MNRQLARRLPLLGKWVRNLEALEEKYARLKKQRDDLKAQLTQVKAGLEVFKRERDERRARLHRLECQLPVPPEPLRSRVHGMSDEVTFLSYGYEIASSIKQLLGAEGLQFDSFARILDFGCGCGRVLRFFEQRPPTCKLFATDIDEEAISWCRHHLATLATFTANGDRPPLNYEANTFDFIYAISVFTHLPEALEILWLEELQRTVKPGGILFLTVHGERLFQNVPKGSQDELSHRGFCHTNCGITSGLPEYYQTSFHREEYIRRRWSDFFQIRTIAALGDQDLVVCEKRASV